MKKPEEDLTPVTTRGGDDGRSGLIDGSRRFKDDMLFEALGFIDESQVAIGCCRNSVIRQGEQRDGVKPLPRLVKQLESTQYLMLTAGGVMACPVTAPPGPTQPVITEEDISRIDGYIEWWRDRTELEPRFFIAGDTLCGAEFDRARTVVRRAERAVVAVVRHQGLEEQKRVSRFLNRLSDWMFILARWADMELADTVD
ncbi:MAG: ATP:cob(I)alamin adenosyltransferase [Spirochaetaceae bacterium]|nr:MAG: ATP:cob(I)alamin adenosyltransferase [Spirochaetaceae bacterium]